MNAHTRAEALRLVDKLPSDATLDAVDDDARSGRRLCPLDNLTLNDVRQLRALLSADDVPDGRRMAAARDEFFASLSGATLAGAPTGVHLRNRLELAFVEGWKAATTPPNGETK